MALTITNGAQALYMAVEMEKRAIRMYERLLLLDLDEATKALVNRLLADEKSHLIRFSRHLEKAKCALEDAMLLRAQADDLLFAGGLSEMQREGGLKSAERLLRYATEQEDMAVERYAAFAEMSEGEAQAAFRLIADEERRHKQVLVSLSRKAREA